MATYAYTFTSGDTVTPTKLNNARTVSDIVNADIKSDAAIALSKLATGALPTAITVATANIVDANVTPAKLSQPLTLGTSQNTTSGTSIDFTGIPSWVRRITLILNGVSTSGIGNLRILLGDAGGFETTGYTSIAHYIGVSAVGASTQNTGFISEGDAAVSANRSGTICFNNVSGNIWCVSGSYGVSLAATALFLHGKKGLSDTLTQIRLTTSNGTDTFNGGSVNIMYEG